eukprot:3113956-Pyramimonas_sp.AAC.1
MASLKELARQELAEETGEKGRAACFASPPGSASAFRSLPGFERYDESIHCLQCFKPGTGTKDAPRASLRPRKTATGFGLRPTSYDEEFEANPGVLTAKHVDAIMAGAEGAVDKCVECVRGYLWEM